MSVKTITSVIVHTICFRFWQIDYTILRSRFATDIQRIIMSKNENLQVVTSKEVLGKNLSVYGTVENPLFKADDVANWIDHSNTSKMLKSIDEDEKVKLRISTLTNGYSAIFLTEDGLYEVLMQSRKPIAKQFKKEVKAILKQIRKTGGYIPISEEDDEKTIMAKGYTIAMKTIEEKDRVIQQKDETIKQLEPKAKMCDKFLLSKGYISLNKTAKGLKLGINKMMAFLRSKSVLFKEDNDNIPYQQFINSGYFIIDYHNGRDGKLHAVTKVSAKGIKFIHKLYLKYVPYIMEVA